MGNITDELAINDLNKHIAAVEVSKQEVWSKFGPQKITLNKYTSKVYDDKGNIYDDKGISLEEGYTPIWLANKLVYINQEKQLCVKAPGGQTQIINLSEAVDLAPKIVSRENTQTGQQWVYVLKLILDDEIEIKKKLVEVDINTQKERFIAEVENIGKYDEMLIAPNGKSIVWVTDVGTGFGPFQKVDIKWLSLEDGKLIKKLDVSDKSIDLNSISLAFSENGKELWLNANTWSWGSGPGSQTIEDLTIKYDLETGNKQDQKVYGTVQRGLDGIVSIGKLGISKPQLAPVRYTGYQAPTQGIAMRTLNKRQYELVDHLGNVRVVVGDYKTKIGDELFSSPILAAYDYYAGGMLMPGRSFNLGDYRFGFNGQEKVDEIVPGHYTAEYWEYDSRTGRRWNLDPVPQIAISDYAVNRNNPIYYNDPDGDCPNCITAAIGAGVGALIGGGIEIGMQLYNNGSVNNWSAVGGSAAQGFVTGGAAGFTGGASLLVTAGVAGGANVVGGAINNKIQGKPVTVVSTATDLLVGAAFGALGYGAKALYTKTLANRVSSIFSSAPKNASLSNAAAREWYLSQESKIVGLLDKTKSLEDQAKQASGLRNAFRTKARELMSDTEEATRLMKDEPNMNWSDVVDKYSEGGKYSGDKLWNRIIEATQRSRKSVNESLGVKPKK